MNDFGKKRDAIIQKIETCLQKTRKKNAKYTLCLADEVILTEYAPCNDRWTQALQRSLREHEIVVIPSSEKPYLIDGPIVIPSNRRIVAQEGAVIRLVKGTKTLMLRNENTADGSYSAIKNVKRDKNITIEGGVWEEECDRRLGYGQSGRYDENRSFYGVSTCMFFDNIDHLTLKNLTFRRCGGFAVQMGEAKHIVMENIRFENCYADGLHINGNTENIIIRNVSGQVRDDLVALNMYDWQNSSVNFGPIKNVLGEDLTLSSDSPYKAIRIEPGIYTFDDGSTVDCSLTNCIFRRVNGIKTFKMYCQTPAYNKGTLPEKADVGSGDNIIFEDIKIDLDSPIDLLGGYVESDPITGSFAAFELGLNINNLYLKNISLTLSQEKYPYSYLICIGPKSVRLGDREIFDPYFSSCAANIFLENIAINGKKVADIAPFICEIKFDGLYSDMPSTAQGVIENIFLLNESRN